jgi:nucleoside-diphosphate-sugar epimerase
MRILLTGHKGYIGTVLVPVLTGEGHAVKGLDCNLFEKCTFGNPPPEIPCINKDIRDIRASDLEGFEAVIHLAGLSNDPLGNLNPALTYEINHHAAVRVAETAKKAGVMRFLFSSSCSNYGAAGNELLNEEAKLCPVTPYARSKVLAEQDIAKLAETNFSPTFLRSGTAFGVSPSLRFDLVLNNLVAWAFTTGKVYLKSDGSPWRPIVHVEDISLAFSAVLNAPREVVHNQAFNVGHTGENYQIRELAEIVKETVPGSQIEYAEDAGPDKRCYKVDFSKLAQYVPEFKPRWNARRGAGQLHQAFMETGLCLADFEGPQYKRIDHIKKLLDEGILDRSLRRKRQGCFFD